MSPPVTLALVHSPLVGPLTWRAVAAELSGEFGVVVPSAAGATQREIAEAVAASLDVDGPVILIGHSGAGRLLPRIARAVRSPVAGLIYADSALPEPGRSWMDTAPPERARHLRGLAEDGMLPPWHEWFPPEVLAETVPDPGVRSAFVREIPRLPLGYFTEPGSPDRWTGPAGYLLLSEDYRASAEQARRAGLPVAEVVSHHLAMLTDPVAVGAGLRELVARW
ncbi:alpha/beta fold hydrolase [Actinoplanes sp. NPDC051470]|uniref:alpha/beta fold hydrolase n=1 Tax=unclassified Actinoplanes TaxID=2626549 RepID=UPI003427F0D0